MSKGIVSFDHSSLLIWLRLSFTPRIGTRALLKLLSRYSLSELTLFTEPDWKQSGLSDAQIYYILRQSVQDAQLCLEWAEQSPSRVILPYLDPDYPSLLREIPSPPAVLFVSGDVSVLSDPQIAMVGSRNASRIGNQTAEQFAADFTKKGMVVTSGLALGIDGHAHNGALNAGGKTVAVLGAGLRHIYPARHQGLAKRVEEQGALVSEFAPNVRARAEYFPRRNRIISGLSAGVVIVEAAEKSGSLITAKYATEQGRDVFVIPGSIHQANCRGSNDLIRQGAILVQTSDQVLQEARHLVSWSMERAKPAQRELFPANSDKEELPFPELLANVGIEATPIDIIAARTHIPVQEAMVQLLELELCGHVEAVSGGYILRGRG